MSVGPLIAPGSPRTQATARRRHLPIAVVASAIVVVLILLCAIFGSLIAPQDVDHLDLVAVAKGPSSAHLLGTDQLGRDVFSRAIAGARTPVAGAVAIALGAALLGSIVGVLAGYYGGFVETGTMRLVDLMISLPAVLVAIVTVSILGSSYGFAVLLLTIFLSPFEVRMMRGIALEQRSRPYVEAAHSAGLSSWRIMARHIWPNVLPILVADAFLNFAYALVALSTLSFLGLGVALGTPDWGRMLFEGKDLLFQNPAAAIAPAVLIALTAASVATLGDAAFERLSDRGRGR